MGKILITGASGDIGKSIALKMHKEGYDLILTYNKGKESMDELMNLISTDNGTSSVTALQVDLSNYGDSEKKLTPYADDIDAVIHTAGVSYIGLLQDMSIDEWNNVINTNLTSCFNISKILLPDMIRRKSGRLLFISSVWGNEGASVEVAYSASKGGMNSFVKALSKEVAPSGIAVNAIAPGLIDTKMNAHLSTEDMEDLFAEIPAGRAGTTTEVADLCYLTLQAPIYMTGQIITMDGGWC